MTTLIPPIAQTIIQAWPEQPSLNTKKLLIDWLKAGLARQRRGFPIPGIVFTQDGQRGIQAIFGQGRDRHTVGVSRRHYAEHQHGDYWKVFVITPKPYTPDPEMVKFATASAKRLAGVE